MAEMFNQFLPFDLNVFEWVQSIHNSFLDFVTVAMSYLGEAGIIFMVLAFALMLTKKYRKVGFAIIVALAVMVICNNVVLKTVFARPRPFNLEFDWWNAAYKYPELVSRPDSFSFPSGHTSSAFAAAFAVLWYNRKFGIPLTLFACLMGFSRIYVGVHYCTDVIAGAVVGLVYAIIAVIIVNLLYPRLYPKIEQKLNSIKEKKNAKA